MNHKIIYRKRNLISITYNYVFICSTGHINMLDLYNGSNAVLRFESGEGKIPYWLNSNCRAPSGFGSHLDGKYWNSYCAICNSRVVTDEEQELINTISRMGGNDALHEYLKEYILDT